MLGVLLSLRVYELLRKRGKRHVDSVVNRITIINSVNNRIYE